MLNPGLEGSATLNKSNLDIRRAVELCQMLHKSSPDDLDRHEILFAELDEILDRASNHAIDEILIDPAYQEIGDSVLRIRAQYEYDREVLLADEMIKQNSTSAKEGFRSTDWYDTGLSFENEALAPYNPKKILFVGSGPYPTSPIAYQKSNPEAQVYCMERELSAVEKSRKIADIFEVPELEIINTDGTTHSDFSQFDCVIVGLVVGETIQDKDRIVEHFLKNVKPGQLLCFRTAVGPGRVVYPNIKLDRFKGMNYILLENPPHKSFSLVILDR